MNLDIKIKNKKAINELRWFAFLLPILFIYALFSIYPTIGSIYYAFTDWDGLTSSFIGLDNFKELFQDKMIITSFKNTLMYSVFITVFQNMIGLCIAVMMVRKFKGVNILRTAFFMPAIFSPLLIGYIWRFMLEPNYGVLNTVLEIIGLENLIMPWLSDPSWARWMIIVITIWQFLGYSMVIYIAGLKAIPEELYEAARVDGAKAMNQFTHITFPLVAPALTINIILSTIGTMKLFEQVYALTGGGPGYTTQSVATMIYELGFKSVRWGYGSAMSTVLFVIIMSLTVLQVTILRRREVEM